MRRDEPERKGQRTGLTRRAFLSCGTVAAVAATSPWVWRTHAATVTVDAAFDVQVQQFMQARQVPGAALAVLKDDRLVYARGYGWADRDAQVPARADTLFRIASLSKPITALAVLKLVEQGKLELDTPAFGLLKLEPLPSGKGAVDLRLAQVTVRHLLHHTAGWDSTRSFDPMFRSRQIARAAGEPPPASPRTIIRFMLGRALDFDPGSRYAYSNFGYCVLGRVIEAVTGLSYETYVQQQLLAPLGIRRMRIGQSRRSTDGEARYYTAKPTTARSVFADGPAQVPWPYGGFCLESMDAHGGWIASVLDLARLTAALRAPERHGLLRPATLKTMVAPPPPPVSRRSDGSLEPSWYGCGWSVRPVGQTGRFNCWHTGSLPGSYGLWVLRWDGLSWVVLFNQRSEDPTLPEAAIDAALHQAADAVTIWPEPGASPSASEAP